MKIALLGYGKMGRVIEKIAVARGHQIELKTNSSTLFSAEDLQGIDVAIEFSTPKNAVFNINTCFDANVPVVVGTTGWYNEFEKVKERCEKEGQALLYATNFSIGVNLFFEINKKMATLMNAYPQYDVMIEEIHHTEKLDAPSGTAISTAEQIIERLERKSNWKNDEETKADDLYIASKRIENVPGTHTVSYISSVDKIELRHTAKSRDGFGLGAVLAAEFIRGKKGIFTMKDILFGSL